MVLPTLRDEVRSPVEPGKEGLRLICLLPHDPSNPATSAAAQFLGYFPTRLLDVG